MATQVERFSRVFHWFSLLSPEQVEIELPADPQLVREERERVMRFLTAARSDRRCLLEVASGLDPLSRSLASLLADHRQRYGATRAGAMGAAALRAMWAVQYDARPMNRYLPAEHLRDRIWGVLREVDRTVTALLWERLSLQSRR